MSRRTYYLFSPETNRPHGSSFSFSLFIIILIPSNFLQHPSIYPSISEIALSEPEHYIKKEEETTSFFLPNARPIIILSILSTILLSHFFFFLFFSIANWPQCGYTCYLSCSSPFFTSNICVK